MILLIRSIVRHRPKEVAVTRFCLLKAIRGKVRLPERRTQDAVNLDRSRQNHPENLTKTELSDPISPSAFSLIDMQEVGKLLACSTRQVYRMSDAGRMPPPMKLGALVHWSRPSIESSERVLTN